MLGQTPYHTDCNHSIPAPASLDAKVAGQAVARGNRGHNAIDSNINIYCVLPRMAARSRCGHTQPEVAPRAFPQSTRDAIRP
jgi:hypothetical protein